MDILIIGGRGQLGKALTSVFRENDDNVIIWNRPDYDISSPTIARTLRDLSPNIVINAAAYTDVDGAERHPQTAYAVNSLGPHYLALGCQWCNAILVQVSTNEVFAGTYGSYYREYDFPTPGGIYAKSKLAGEDAAKCILQSLYIVRTAWVFGGENDFPSKIIQAAQKHHRLRVVDDEFGTPTYAPDLASAIVQLTKTGYYGTYHLTNNGVVSRYGWAKSIMACVNSDIEITPISSSEWQRASTPPPHAVLENQAAAELGISMRSWQASLAEYLDLRKQL